MPTKEPQTTRAFFAKFKGELVIIQTTGQSTVTGRLVSVDKSRGDLIVLDRAEWVWIPREAISSVRKALAESKAPRSVIEGGEPTLNAEDYGDPPLD